ncbi:PLP-dependent cysteine synthase family protein [Paraburkholderia sp. BL6669N2]|nr:cysteine synthase family protein [Paraburkholderia sp. BL6669N2]
MICAFDVTDVGNLGGSRFAEVLDGMVRKLGLVAVSCLFCGEEASGAAIRRITFLPDAVVWNPTSFRGAGWQSGVALPRAISSASRHRRLSMDSNENSFHQILVLKKDNRFPASGRMAFSSRQKLPQREDKQMIVNSILDTIGNTPLLFISLRGGEIDLYLKLEMFNPTGSMKDRMALSMINSRPNEAVVDIVESSSGNTASALAMISAVRGINFTALMDSHASPDKILTVRALGSNVRTVGSGDGALATDVRDREAMRMSAEEDAYWTEQHNNPANSAGYVGLAAELLDDLGPTISHLVCAIGTGGSLCGTARHLRRHIPSIQVIGVEPAGSVIFGGQGAQYHQSGTGTPEGAEVGVVIDYNVIDSGRKVRDDMAFSICHHLAQRHGLLVGGSTGGAIYEALSVAREAPIGSRIVTLACDSGTKYLDTIFNQDWLSTHDIQIIDVEKHFADLFADAPSSP